MAEDQDLAGEVLEAAEALVDESLGAYERSDAAHALRAADEALELAPELARAHHARSLALEGLGRLPEARLAAERSATLDGDRPGIHAQLGDLWLAEDPARAERHYRDGVRRDTWDRPARARARLLACLGAAMAAQGRRREAALAYRSAHLLDPSRREHRRSLREAIQDLAPGAALLAGVWGLAKAAKTARHAAKLEALRPYAGWLTGAAMLLLAAAGGLWLWRRTAGLARLATEEPELHALYRRLEADKRVRG